MKVLSRLKRHMTDSTVESLVTRKMPRLPAGGSMLWRWFLDLSRTRSYHMMGPNPISHVEIAAYCQLHQIAMQPHHVEILRAMDEAYLDHLASNRARHEGLKPLPHRSASKIDAGLFDALFG
jgi:hypothetical protein